MKCIDCDGEGLVDSGEVDREPLNCGECGGTGEVDPESPIKTVAEALCAYCNGKGEHHEQRGPIDYEQYMCDDCGGTGLRWPSFSQICPRTDQLLDRDCCLQENHCSEHCDCKGANRRPNNVTLERVVTEAMSQDYSQRCQWLGGVMFRVMGGFGGWFTLSERERIEAACASLLEVEYD